MFKLTNILSLLILIGAISMCMGYPQIITFYENDNFEGPNYTFTTHVPNTAIFPIANTKAICVGGAWIPFDDENYENPWYYGLLFSPNASSLCVTTNGQVLAFKSFRFGGAQDTKESAISIYSQDNQIGSETLIFAQDSGATGLSGKSVLYTGKGQWTLFENDAYQGKSICTQQIPMAPEMPDFEIGGYFNVSAQLGLTQITSVLYGCVKSTNV